MIRLYKATRESRARDKKCNRYILQIGQSQWHLRRAELFQVVIKGLKALNCPRTAKDIGDLRD